MDGAFFSKSMGIGVIVAHEIDRSPLCLEVGSWNEAGLGFRVHPKPKPPTPSRVCVTKELRMKPSITERFQTGLP